MCILLYFVFQTSYYLNRLFQLIAVKVLSTYLKSRDEPFKNQFSQPYSWDQNLANIGTKHPLPPYNTKSYFDISPPPPVTYYIIIERPLKTEFYSGQSTICSCKKWSQWWIWRFYPRIDKGCSSICWFWGCSSIQQRLRKQMIILF